MTLAWRLRQRGFTVTIIEGAPSSGGLTSPQSIGEYTWDRFYHVTLQSDLNLRALLGEIGLDHLLRWETTRTGFYVDGNLYSMSSSLDFLRFPPLSLVDKGRLAATILLASRIKDWRRLEAIPVTDWLRRWSGRRTFDRIWLPLLKSKLGDNYRLASAAFIWAIIARMYAARRSGLKRESFGYVEGGYDTVLRSVLGAARGKRRRDRMRSGGGAGDEHAGRRGCDAGRRDGPAFRPRGRHDTLSARSPRCAHSSPRRSARGSAEWSIRASCVRRSS